MVTPIYGHLLVEIPDSETKTVTKLGLHLPKESIQNEYVQSGKILAISTRTLPYQGQTVEINPEFEVGKTILFYRSKAFPVPNEKQVLVDHVHVLAIVN
jgi:co-chaperonin GroES (HSP10)